MELLQDAYLNKGIRNYLKLASVVCLIAAVFVREQVLAYGLGLLGWYGNLWIKVHFIDMLLATEHMNMGLYIAFYIVSLLFLIAPFIIGYFVWQYVGLWLAVAGLLGFRFYIFVKANLTRERGH